MDKYEKLLQVLNQWVKLQKISQYDRIRLEIEANGSGRLSKGVLGTVIEFADYDELIQYMSRRVTAAAVEANANDNNLDEFGLPREEPLAIKVLSLRMRDNDAGAETVEQYLLSIVAAVWEEKEGFSGKRPFGNSGWEFDLYAALIDGGVIVGKLNDGGAVEELSNDEQIRADEIIAEAIGAL